MQTTSETMKTDFEFLGNRDYIHSSTIISEFVRLMDTPIYEVDASFNKKVTGNGYFSNKPNSHSVVIVANNSAFYFTDKGWEVRKRTYPKYHLIDYGDGTYHIVEHNNMVKGYIREIIEANKKWHLERYKLPQVLCLSVYNIPVTLHPCQIKIENISERISKGRIITKNKILYLGGSCKLIYMAGKNIWG